MNWAVINAFCHPGDPHRVCEIGPLNYSAFETLVAVCILLIVAAIGVLWLRSMVR